MSGLVRARGLKLIKYLDDADKQVRARKSPWIETLIIFKSFYRRKSGLVLSLIHIYNDKVSMKKFKLNEHSA